MKSKHSPTRTVLLILDMLNLFDFPEATQLHKSALSAAQAILKLKRKFKVKKLPVIYVNDDFGKWRSDWKDVYRACVEPGRLGREIAHILKPEPDDYFILKPKHSGFYMTALDLLLNDLGARTLVITGIAGNICVLFTANDAHMRDYEVIVPQDCSASNTARDQELAIRHLRNVLGIKTPKSIPRLTRAVHS